jgi:hypothetical protein
VKYFFALIILFISYMNTAAQHNSVLTNIIVADSLLQHPDFYFVAQPTGAVSEAESSVTSLLNNYKIIIFFGYLV